MIHHARNPRIAEGEPLAHACRELISSMNTRTLLPCVSLGLVAVSQLAAGVTPEELEFFESKIRPVLAESCYECHNSTGKMKGDIALDYKGAMDAAKIIVPGDPEKSTLIQAIRHAKDFEAMPDKSPKLSNLVIRNFEEWVLMGAPDPRLAKPTKEELESQVDWGAVRDRRAQWWSFQPVKKADPPRAENADWDRNAVDRFIFAGLKSNGLSPQTVADPGTLVRRLHLVLTGLPPSPELVEAFVADPSETAYASLVDGLMASKHYGEHWGRHWMDWFRYAESYGSEGDPAVPYARQYRDYVIRAINADVPYNQLIREHIAGDLLENPRMNDELGLNESAIGPAQMRMVPHGFGVTDVYDEQITFTDNQIDAVTKAMLATTVSCARCHNHKFDPISQKDFYKLYGIMVSSRPAIVNVDSPKLQEMHVHEIEKLKKDMRRTFGSHWLGELDDAMAKMEKNDLGKLPGGDPLYAWVKLKGLSPDPFQREWDAMKANHRAVMDSNEKTRQDATFYADLRNQSTYDQWFGSGNGLDPKVSPAGSFALAPEGGDTFTGIYPRGVYTHMITDKHNGFLNSRFHVAEGERAMVRAVGSASIARFSVRSYPLSQGLLHPAAGLKPESQWVNLNKYKYWNNEKGYFQINTGADSTFMAGQARSWFGIYEAYAGNGSLRDPGSPLVALPGDHDRILDRASLLAFYRTSLQDAVRLWMEDAGMGDAQAQLLNAFVSRGFLANRIDALPAVLKAQVENYRKLEKEIRIPARAPGVAEGEPWDQPLLERGSHKDEKEPVARGFLEVFGGEEYETTGSGRRELAEDMIAEDNTLIDRVIVNRLWHHTFGQGIVASTDNFGRLGKEPTHPELLDYLASDFRENGWSMKGTVRQLVMSRAFRSASTTPGENGDKDPLNLQLAYFTPRRLGAEAILDTIRFVAGNKVPQRAVYNPVKRNDLDPFLATFNFPIPTSTVGVRDLTNVPAQALTLMNGNITKEASIQWSRRIAADGALKTDPERIDRLFMQAYSRRATPGETAACMAYLAGEGADAYTRLAHALLNSKELIYVH